MLNIPVWNRVLIWGVVMFGLAFALPNLWYPRVERHNDALAAIETTGISTSELELDVAGWPGVLPSTLVNLGLDLRGGAHLLAEVQVEDVYVYACVYVYVVLMRQLQRWMRDRSM